MKLRTLAATLALTLGVHSVAWAEPTSQTQVVPTYKTLNEEELRACLFISDDQLRLRCFDQATGRAAVTVAAKPPAAVANLDGGFLLFPEPPAQSVSWFNRRWELDPDSKTGTFQIRPYKPVYLLPVFYNSRLNTLPTSPNPANQVQDPLALQHTESKFQISLKTKIAENLIGNNGDLWFGYTQSSRWQVYNQDQSRPFRETNYEPEIMFTWRASWKEFAETTGWSPRMLGLSLNHQSNGRAQPLSRSWNRLIGMVGLERKNTLFQVRPWVRLRENLKDDDNPNISDTMGRVDYLLVHKAGGHEFSLLARHNNRFNRDSKGAVQADWAFPIHSNLRGHVQAFSGYGESLIDYNHRSDYLGVGLSLLGWY